MPDPWWPEAARHYPATTPPLTFAGGPAKGVLHTTEGSTIAGAVAAYRANRSWPHVTMSFEGGVFRAEQHLPVDQAARALRNAPGGAETNRDRAIQAELVGRAADPRWPREFFDGVRRWMRWVEAVAGVQRRCDVAFKAYPASYGANNGERMSGPAWDAYGGWCGHQHVPENTHGDPGAIDIAYLLAGPPTPTTPEEAHVLVPGIIATTLVPGASPDAKGRFPFWAVKADGSVLAFNGAPFFGPRQALGTSAVIGIHARSDRPGYVLVTNDADASSGAATYAFPTG